MYSSEWDTHCWTSGIETDCPESVVYSLPQNLNSWGICKRGRQLSWRHPPLSSCCYGQIWVLLRHYDPWAMVYRHPMYTSCFLESSLKPGNYTTKTTGLERLRSVPYLLQDVWVLYPSKQGPVGVFVVYWCCPINTLWRNYSLFTMKEQ